MSFWIARVALSVGMQIDALVLPGIVRSDVGEKTASNRGPEGEVIARSRSGQRVRLSGRASADSHDS